MREYVTVRPPVIHRGHTLGRSVWSFLDCRPILTTAKQTNFPEIPRIRRNIPPFYRIELEGGKVFLLLSSMKSNWKIDIRVFEWKILDINVVEEMHENGRARLNVLSKKMRRRWWNSFEFCFCSNYF